MARTTLLPRKRIETSRPPRTDWPAERAVGVAAKAPTAKPPAAPTAAPIRNLVVPSPNRKLLRAFSRFDGASLAQRPAASSRARTCGLYCRSMLETAKKERLRSLPAVDAVLRDPA